ncbi:sulfatase-like hydrolase/transferase [Pelagicoccus sp. NFK12]|uniref:Sulfatase-like hydrolase/transferase n=1 Tax=Pelagicoccus enzymogenes TaxID=2773457 RepID=A0A927FA77_9BACT|nr:sulfatase-like hydrolase/transferase [Pelagicoccus enzymogenes]MBD5780685.1 sulfatase-like hydrolase/transferase [Pelagicoccus enzymogenes]
MSEKRKNILFLFTDQFRADCIGALGNSQIKTPNLDRLVRSGTAFTRCYTPSPVCVAARHALTCGVSPHQTGCVDNVDIECHRTSFMDELNMLEYQTHGVGKMHFVEGKGDWGFQSRDVSEELVYPGVRDDYRDYLAKNGFEHVLDPHGLRSEYYYLPQPSQLPDRHHNTTWVADRSIDFLRNRDRDRPFFLWSSFIKPHPPFETPIPWSRIYSMHEMDEPYLPDGYEEQQSLWNRVQNRYKYRDGGYDRHISRMIRAAYYATISHVDFHLGRILDALGDEIENTLVVFSSDHGEMLGDFGCYGKRCMLDASARIPMLASLPGVIPEGEICDRAVSLLDLYPTFIDTADPLMSKTSLEGTSLVSTLEGNEAERVVFSQFSQNGLGLYLAADSKWKYVYSAADEKEWLYRGSEEEINLAADPAFSGELIRLRESLFERFKGDGYDAPWDGEGWRQFPKWEMPAAKDYGLLRQDPPELQQEIAALGVYERPRPDTANILKELADFSTQSGVRNPR